MVHKWGKEYDDENDIRYCYHDNMAGMIEIMQQELRDKVFDPA